MKAMQKTYGSNWAHVYYGLANKRSGRGLRGKHRGHVAANSAYAKGKHWGGKSRRRTTSSRSRSRSLTVHTRGRTSVTRRTRNAHVRVRVH